jgi:importin subunit beta-1
MHAMLTMYTGAILEGPKSYLSQLITQAIPVLLQHLKSDPVVYVKDTTAWTIGRVCQLHASALSGNLTNVVQILAQSLADSPRVAANVCWSLHNLALAYEDDADKHTSALSPFFQGLIEKLLQTTER